MHKHLLDVSYVLVREFNDKVPLSKADIVIVQDLTHIVQSSVKYHALKHKGNRQL